MTTTASKGTGTPKFRTQIRLLAQQHKRQRQQNERAVRRERDEQRRWRNTIAAEEKRRLAEDRGQIREERKRMEEERRRIREKAKRLRDMNETLEQRERRLRRNEKARERRVRKAEELRIANEVLTPVLSKKALKGMAMKYVITPVQTYEPVSFLRKAENAVIELLNGLRGTQARNVRVRLVCEMVRTNPETGQDEITDAGFATGNWKLYGEDDAGNIWGGMREKMLESFPEYQRRGSGWRVSRVVMLEIHIGKFIPLSGSGQCPLPKKIVKKKAVVNMENSDNQCFRWAVTRALNPTVSNPGRITKRLREQSAELDWTSVEFPTPIDSKSISTFEDRNGVNINVFSADDMHKVFPLRVSRGFGRPTAEGHERRTVRLFLWGGHYSVVKNMSRLASSQLSGSEHRKFVCDSCLNAFGSARLLEKHTEACLSNAYQRQEYPKPGETLEFKRYVGTQEFPIAIYADFECFIEPLTAPPVEGDKTHPQQSSTTRYQKHNPSGFAYYVKCVNDSIMKPELVRYTQQYEGEDVAEMFVESVEAVVHEFYRRTKSPIPVRMTHDTRTEHTAATACYACGGRFTPSDPKTADHCHYTGKYRGAAHNSCNLAMVTPEFLPVYFHNLEGYDAHLFVRNLGATDGDIKCIPKTEERYISFSKEIVVDTYVNSEGKLRDVKRDIRFLDSFKLMASSLDKLSKGMGKEDFANQDWYCRGKGYTEGQKILLRQKGVYPYEYMSSFDRLGETALPSKDSFYSSLAGEHISDGEYTQARAVWEAFGMKTMRDYHDLYLETDVMLLADIMESFRKVCMVNYGLDPLWYYTSPGLAWDACLKLTDIKLDLISDPDMYLFVEKGIRGGISTITKR